MFYDKETGNGTAEKWTFPHEKFILYSARTGKTFDADLVLTETVDKNGARIASFQLEFPNSKSKPR